MAEQPVRAEAAEAGQGAGLLSGFGPQGRERVVHARGCGAFGSFTVTRDITAFTRARLFGEVGKRTALLARFSRDGGEGGPLERDLHGFALKFYTEEGNWDLVGHDTPVFFIRDPAKFADFVRSRSRDPATRRRSAATMWDFMSRHPETLHQLVILFSDRGRPASPRFMSGYGGHAYSFWNDRGQRFWVKYHVKTMQGYRAAADGDDGAAFAGDLERAIARGDAPRWRLCVQILTEAQAASFAHDPFDVTKVWPQVVCPLREVGIVELDRNPTSQAAEIEPAAFGPSNVVPGIGFSPDRMLQARIFSYAEAHRARLGAHYEALTVNAPRTEAGPYCRVGSPATPRGAGGEGVPAPEASAAIVQRAGAALDDFAQPRAMFRAMGEEARARLCLAIAGALAGVPAEVAGRQLGLFREVDAAFGAGVAAACEAAVAAAA